MRGIGCVLGKLPFDEMRPTALQDDVLGDHLPGDAGLELMADETVGGAGYVPSTLKCSSEVKPAAYARP